jgi:hypothetical protein
MEMILLKKPSKTKTCKLKFYVIIICLQITAKTDSWHGLQDKNGAEHELKWLVKVTRYDNAIWPDNQSLEGFEILVFGPPMSNS